MAARSQTTFFPSDAPACKNIAATPFCQTCNEDQKRSCVESDQTHDCETVCNECQNSCNKKQSYCALSKQKITDHPDTTPFPSFCMAKNEIIYKNWTSTNWNRIIANLQTAYKLGRLVNHGSAPAMSDKSKEDIVTATAYNQIAAGLNGFLSSSNPTVAKDDVIKAALVIAQQTNYNNAQFNTSVCDICNGGKQVTITCSCDCNSACSCNCTCSGGPPSA